MQTERTFSVSYYDTYWRGEFFAMASPCQILIDQSSESEARHLTELAAHEAWRIQDKFSRYQPDNIIHRINHANGLAVEVDDETAALLDYAAQCYELSEGLFDITSGVLREAWNFDCSDRIPSQVQIDAILPRIGWQKVEWQRPILRMPAGMQVDLGGIGKEYAVDRSLLLLSQQTSLSVLVNYGGDLCTAKPRSNGQGWIVGIEDPAIAVQQIGAGKKKKNKPGKGKSRATQAIREFELQRGGIATSGDTRRYLQKDGKRYSHILDPRTGWPADEAPHSITTVANSCTEAGVFATLAMLHGRDAEVFLEQQGLMFWSQR